MAKQQVYTKRCRVGGCAGDFGQPSFIPDSVDTCDFCLLNEYGLSGKEKYDGCGDPYSMDPLYDRDDVVRALRKAEKGNNA